MTTCSSCTKEITESSAFCPHCGTKTAASVAAVPAAQSANYEMFILGLPIVGTLLIWFWIGSMNLLQGPDNSLTLVSILTVVGSALAIGAEAKALGMSTNKETGSYGPTTWIILVALLWIVGYPAYLFKRARFGAKNRVVLGVLLALIFVGSLVLMNMGIEERKTQIRESFSQVQTQLQSEVQPQIQDAAANFDQTMINESIAQYKIVKRSGSKADVCVQAMQVSAAYLQAKDENNYKAWKTTEKADCAAAGMPVE